MNHSSSSWQMPRIRTRGVVARRNEVVVVVFSTDMFWYGGGGDFV